MSEQSSTTSATEQTGSLRGKIKYGLLITTSLLVFGILAYGANETLRHGPKKVAELTAAQEAQKALLPIGKEAPNFILPGIDGKDYHLQSYRGKKYVLVEIFASWCPHCQASVETLNTLYKTNNGKLEVLAINAGDKPPQRSTSRDFQMQFGATYPILEEPSDTLMAAYRLDSYPTMYLVDKQGNIIYSHNGELHEPDVAAINALLK